MGTIISIISKCKRIYTVVTEELKLNSGKTMIDIAIGEETMEIVKIEPLNSFNCK